MVTGEEYNEAKRVIKKYEDLITQHRNRYEKIIENFRKEQLALLKIELSKIATTTIPKDNWGVHETHCCFDHGCKYGDEDCPVSLGLTNQEYPCEFCNNEY